MTPQPATDHDDAAAAAPRTEPPPLSAGGRAFRLFPATLAGRLALTYVAVVIVVMAALGQYLSLTARDFYVSGLMTGLRNEAMLISTILSGSNGAGPTVEAFDAMAKELGAQLSSRITIIDRDGTVLS
ncbi:MAG: hypothetical protein M3509_00810, partial [Chloroflexota bacterium]|nr:hypothetical protein [Chloroflexota bacterium]